MARPRSDRHLVVTMVGDYLPMFEMAVPCEVFGIRRPEIPGWRYEHIVAAVRPRPIPAGNGLLVTPQAGIEALAEADTILVPGWNAPDRYVEPELVAALLAAHGRGARLVSVCTGAFALAATGLLDGTPRHHPLDARRGARGAPPADPTSTPRCSTWTRGRSSPRPAPPPASTCASTWCARTWGPRRPTPWLAAWSSRRTATAGQAQFVQTPVPPGAEDDTLGPVLTWMAEHLDEGLTVDDLAAPGAGEPAHLRPALRRGDRHDADPVVAHPAGAASPGPARDDRSAGRADRPRVRLLRPARASAPTSSGWSAPRRSPTGARSAPISPRRRPASPSPGSFVANNDVPATGPMGGPVRRWS